MSAETIGERIEKDIVIRAPRARVWQALHDTQAFGAWFGADLGPGAFAPGQHVRGQITSPGYTHLTLDLLVDEVVPERRLVWRWPTDPCEPDADIAAQPNTRVVFELEDVPEGTRLTVVESGWEHIPEDRRAELYRGNEDGWRQQVENIARFVDQSA